MKGNKVAVALSGGVDSSTAALLLLKEGWDVSGVFGRFVDKTEKQEEKAREAASAMGIPFYVVDLRLEFKKRVVEHFTEGLKKGVTPNPCAVCNKNIKFGALLKELSSFDFFATGHYVRKKDDSLFIAKDKDQSYFLWMLKKEQIKRSLFPLGEMCKSEAYRVVQSVGIEPASDSQELCFVRESMLQFIKDSIGSLKGSIKDKEGNVLGSHEGAFFYTIGQRKGLDLPGGPFYVIKKEGNTVVVSKDENDLYCNTLELESVNMHEEVSFPAEVGVKIRYNAPLCKGVLHDKSLTFPVSQRAVCPGQSAVFYRDDKLLGGGIIK